MRRITLVFAALTLAACGAPPEVPAISAAAERTLAEGSAKTYMEQVMAFGDESQGTLTTEMQGVIDFESLEQQATMTMSGEGGQAPLIAEQSGKTEIVGQGLVMYMRSDLYASLLTGSKDWVKMDLQAIGEEMGMDINSLTQMRNDPSGQLGYLTGMKDVREVGRESVRGTSTTHYAGTVSFDAVKDEVPEDAVATIEKLQELLDIDEFESEVWLDDEGLARRITFRYDTIPMGTSTTEGTWSMLMEYYDFGVEVDVDIPPPSEVVDLMEVMKDTQSSAP